MSESNTLIIIPARLGATRLPNKPLADINGTPMIIHVMKRAQAANLGPVLVACGDQEIADVVHQHNGQAVLTDPNLSTGTDRVEAAATLFDPAKKYDKVINVQGDLPNLNPLHLVRLQKLMSSSHYDITTLVAPTRTLEEEASPHVVKAILSCPPGSDEGRALYFSRLPLRCGGGHMYHHIGVYGFCRSVLHRFVTLPPSPLEQQERLEQLRALEDGCTIGAAIVDIPPHGVDTEADLMYVRELMKI